MKHRKLAIALTVCAMLTAAGFVSSCHKDNGGDAQVPECVENEALPTEDQLDVTFSGKAVVLGSASTGFNASLVKRLLNSTTELCDDAAAVVFTSGYNMDFSVAQCETMIKSFIDNAAFVFIAPSFPEGDALESNIRSAIASLVAQGVDYSSAEPFLERMDEMKALGKDGLFAETEAVAFRGLSTYVARNLEKSASLSDENSEGYVSTEEGKSETAKCTDEEKYESTAYEHGKCADMLVDWLERKVEESVSGSNGDAENTIKQYMKGHRTEINQSVGPSRALDRFLKYTLTYTVYSAYDFDDDADYYFIVLEPYFRCSDLGCRNGDVTWVSANKVVVFDDGGKSGTDNVWFDRTDLWYGPYMSKFDFTAKLVDENDEDVNNVSLCASSPSTDVSGSSGYSTGMTYSLSGNIGFNAAGPLGGVTTGFGFSESHSHTERDLRVVHKKEDNCPRWIVTGITPQCHLGFFRYYHDEVATFQKTDWQTEFTWVVKVKNPDRGRDYYLYTSDFTEITELNYNLSDYELRVHPTQHSKIKLDAPNRSRCNFIMSCSDDEVQKLIQNQFSQTWQNEFTYYAQTDNNVEQGAKNMFEAVKVAVKGYAATLVEKGYSGSYTFSLAKSDGTRMASFKLENGEVVE